MRGAQRRPCKALAGMPRSADDAQGVLVAGAGRPAAAARSAAALRIQAVWRGRAARQDAAAQQAASQAAAAAAFAGAQQDRLAAAAASTIQAAWRAHAGRLHVQREACAVAYWHQRKARMAAAATRIQAAWRQRVNCMRTRLEARREAEQRQLAAVVLIQAQPLMLVGLIETGVLMRILRPGFWQRFSRKDGLLLASNAGLPETSSRPLDSNPCVIAFLHPDSLCELSVLSKPGRGARLARAGARARCACGRPRRSC